MINWLYEAIRTKSKNQNIQQFIVQHLYQIDKLADIEKRSILHICADSNNQHIFILRSSETTFPQERRVKWFQQKDSLGFTALHYTVFRKNYKCALLLQQMGCDIYLQNKDGLNLLHLAAQGGSPLLMFYYLGKGFKISSTDYKGNTALHWAAYSNSQFSVAALISWNAEIDLQEQTYGNTPLHFAVLGGNTKIVKSLLNANAETNIRNSKGKTALDISIQKNYEDITQLIQSKDNCFKLKSQKYIQNKKDKPFYISIILLIVNIGLNLIYFFPFDFSTFNVLAIFLLILGLILCSLLAFVSLSNPGIITKYRAMSYFQILKKFQPEQICFACALPKPLRSRHCIICRKCISVYDHHCVWIGNCVGCKNYCLFYAFIVFLICYLIYQITCHIALILFVINDNKQILKIMQLIICVINLILSVFLLLPVLLLVIKQTYNLFVGKTTLQIYIDQKKQTKKSKQLKQITKINLQFQENFSNQSRTETLRSSLFSKEGHSSQHKRSKSIFENCVDMCIKNKQKQQYFSKQI